MENLKLLLNLGCSMRLDFFLIKIAKQAEENKLEKRAIFLLAQYFYEKKLKKNYFLSLREELTIKKQKKLTSFLEKYIVEKKPIEYITNEVFFGIDKLFVNENVLIPRIETEELAEKTLKYIHHFFQQEKIKIIDLGTGSGCLTFFFAKNLPNSFITASDISLKALKIAKKNNKKYQKRIIFIQSDWLEQIKGSFDVIISNPPYLALNEQIYSTVNKEPKLALYGKDKEGLSNYKIILNKIQNHLKKKTILCLEHGEKQQEKIILLIKEKFPNALIFPEKDLFQKSRFLFVFFNK